MKAILLSLIITVFGTGLFAQTGEITGTVTDTFMKAPANGVFVRVYNDGYDSKFITNSGGIYYASNIPTGSYTVEIVHLKKTYTARGIKVKKDGSTPLDLSISAVVELGNIDVTPSDELIAGRDLINPFDPVTSGEVPVETIKEEGAMDIVGVVEKIQSVTITQDNQISIKGARPSATSYVINGSRVAGDHNIPTSAIGYFRVYTGGVPAKYGDTSGGVVVIETKSYFDFDWSEDDTE